MKHRFVLASQSPRRQELLKFLEIEFTIKASDIDEELKEELTFPEVVMDLALQKAVHVASEFPNQYVLGFDTLVILDDEALGKPKDYQEGFEMLRRLSGRKHRVLTGCAIVKDTYKDAFYDFADVTFNPMTDKEIEEYLKTNEPFDKAGAYGIQGYGAKYISKVEGDYYSVMGVPLQKLYNKLRDLK